jgi:NAD+--asparagine ADP-ribosyltransferase
MKKNRHKEAYEKIIAITKIQIEDLKDGGEFTSQIEMRQELLKYFENRISKPYYTMEENPLSNKLHKTFQKLLKQRKDYLRQNN